MTTKTDNRHTYFELGLVIGKLWADKCGENDRTIQTIRESFAVVEEEELRIEEGKKPRGIAPLSITHKCAGPNLCAYLDINQAREPAPDNDGAGRRVAGPC